MASGSGIRISQLQQQFVVTPEDRLVINDENRVTRNISFSNFVSSIAAQDIVFEGDVIFNGDVSVGNIDGGNAFTNITG